jgi:hypothetical protein
MKSPIGVLVTVLGLSTTAVAQTVPSNNSVIPGTPGVGPTVQAPTGSRSTENLSVTSGSRTSLSVGNSTSFGANTNLTLSTGLVGVSRSVLVPKEVGISSTIGTIGSTPGITKINISNLTAKGGGEILPDGSSGAGGSVIDSKDGQYASGNATIDGMTASVKMDIGGADPGNSQVGFYSIVHPVISPASEINRPIPIITKKITEAIDEFGKPYTYTEDVVTMVDGVSPGTGACEPTSGNPCSYVTPSTIVSGNSAAGANLSTTTNIDIQATSFTNTFAQSF